MESSFRPSIPTINAAVYFISLISCIQTTKKYINCKGNEKEFRFVNFPSKKFSIIALASSCKRCLKRYVLPKMDKVTKLNVYTKHYFWLNNIFVQNQKYYEGKYEKRIK